MFRLSLEKKVILITALLAAAAAIIIIFIIYPTIIKIKQADAETVKLRAYLEERYKQSLNLRSTLQEIELIKGETYSWAEYIFSAGDELKLITALEEVAAKNSLRQEVDRFNLDGQNHNAGAISLSISLSGRYADVFNYLSDLEQLPKFINITRLRLIPLPDRANENNVEEATLNLDLTVYVAD